MKSEITTITVLKTTKRKLELIGSKGETFDEILRRLLEVNTHA